mgnify:CR=1 FL=1
MPTENIIALARLPRAQTASFTIIPTDTARAAISQNLGLSTLRKLRFEGQLIPENAHDWRLQAQLSATVVQPCVATLAPVTTRINQQIVRRYVADYDIAHGGEVEMPQDDTQDPLPPALDLNVVMEEALALSIPPYPRAVNAELTTHYFGPPGIPAMTDAAAKPLAGLVTIRDKITPPSNPDDQGE